MDLKDIQIWIWIQIDTNTSMNFETIMKIAILNKNRLGGLVENIEDMYFKNSILRRQFSPESPIVSENKSGCGDQRGALLLLTVGQWHRHLDLEIGDHNDEVGDDSDDDDDVNIDYHDLQPQPEHHVGDQDCTHPQ